MDPQSSCPADVGPAYRDEQSRLLKKYYGYPGLHREQQLAVDGVLRGRDVLVTAPTGFGKSLCFSVPALVRHEAPGGCSKSERSAFTVVVTPLLALMADQVAGLRRRGISAAVISSSQTRKENDAVESALTSSQGPQYAMVYVTAERVTSASFLNVLSRAYALSRIALFAIDEAHCISEWGHDFRRAYAQLGRLRANFPSVPVMALTATATPKVAASILESLTIPNALRVHKSFLRSNIRYRVEYVDGSLCQSSVEQHILEYVLRRREDTGIVYVHRRVTVSDVVELLRSNGVPCAGYHAGLPVREKNDVQEQYERGDVKVIVATTAFGMGIDKADVRYVLHHSLPGSIEGYFQESGRAGRDGKPSESVVYFGERDYETRRYIARLAQQSGGASTQKERADNSERQSRAVEAVASYCTSATCRRVTLLAHFGEARSSADICGSTGCDVCADTQDVKLRMRPVYTRQSVKWRSTLFERPSGNGSLTPSAEFTLRRTLERRASHAAEDSIDLGEDLTFSEKPFDSGGAEEVSGSEETPAIGRHDTQSLSQLEAEEEQERNAARARLRTPRARIRETVGRLVDSHVGPVGFQSARSLMPALKSASTRPPCKRKNSHGASENSVKPPKMRSFSCVSVQENVSTGRNAALVRRSRPSPGSLPPCHSRKRQRLATSSGGEEDVRSFSSDASSPPSDLRTSRRRPRR